MCSCSDICMVNNTETVCKYPECQMKICFKYVGGERVVPVIMRKHGIRNFVVIVASTSKNQTCDKCCGFRMIVCRTQIEMKTVMRSFGRMFADVRHKLGKFCDNIKTLKRNDYIDLEFNKKQRYMNVVIHKSDVNKQCSQSIHLSSESYSKMTQRLLKKFY